MRLSGKARRALTGCAVAGSAAIGLGVPHARGLAHPVPVGVTWTGTVARVLDANCAACHVEGGTSGPRLDDYESARLASQAIKRAVLTGHMPRWYAAAGF